MKRFQCSCGRRLFFENERCLGCAREVGFAPGPMRMIALEVAGDGSLVAADPARTRYRRCRNGVEHGVCNWLVGDDEPGEYCLSCRLNRTIPNLDRAPNIVRWRALEEAKRRLLFTLLELGLPLAAGGALLEFDFLEDRRSNPEVEEEHVAIGHLSGRVTINVAEADAAYRERERVALAQPYRTLLGHFRHEIGHYYWQPLVAAAGRIDEFRRLFGDERADYPAALARFYASSPEGWFGDFVTAYAAAHPIEDWAECFAHFLHMVDTLETATEAGLRAGDDGDMLARWMQLTVTLNELNRSMGLADAYPFVLGEGVAAKLDFIRSTIPGPDPS